MTPKTSINEMSDEEVINYACAVLERRLAYRLASDSVAFICPTASKQYLTLKLAEQEREVFVALFLDTRHRLIKYEEMFFGTIDGASVHAREVVKMALKHNAAAVILAHNHPSGVAEPSAADKQITQHLKEALNVVDIRVLDHIVVAGIDSLSFAESGLI